MKSIYKIIAVVLCVGMIFSFAACTKGASTDNKTSATQNTSTITSAPASQTSSGNAQGDQSATQSTEQSTAQSAEQSAAQSADQSGQGDTSAVDPIFKAAFERFNDGKSQFDALINKNIWSDMTVPQNFILSGRAFGTMNGNEIFTIARDGNKALVNDNGVQTIYVINAEEGTYDFYFHDEWSRGNALTDEVKSVFYDTLSIYTEEVTSSISPLKDYDIAAEDFTYDEEKNAYVTEKELVDNASKLSDITLYLNESNIYRISMTAQTITATTVSGNEYSDPTPVVINYSYDEENNLRMFGYEMEMVVQGVPMSTVLTVDFSYDKDSRIIGFTSRQTIMGMTDNVSITVDYDYTINLPG